MFRLIFYFVFILSVCLISCGDDEVVAPTTGTIKGKVLDAITSQGIAGVSILTTPPTSAVLTNPDGTFTILNVSPGNFNISASKAGYITKSISVAVSAGTDTKADFLLSTVPENNVPTIPFNPIPGNSTTNVSSNVHLSWTSNDPDGDPITFDVFVGKSEQTLEQKVQNLSAPNYQTSNLEKGVKYFWKVNVKDNKGSVTEGPVWSFTVADIIVQQGLVAYYQFNGNTNDESGNGFHASNYEAVLTTDRFNKPNSAYQFDGADDVIEVSNSAGNPNFEPTQALSISCFIYADASIGEAPIARIVRKAGAFNNGYSLTWFGNKPYLEASLTYNGNPATKTVQGDAFGVPNNQFLNQWIHVVMTVDKQSRTCNLFVNGDMMVTGTINYDFQHSGKLFIGGTDGKLGVGGSLYETFPGKIDDVRIYNRVLTGTEINELYHENGF